MKVITLWQPWATWILWEWKTIETRTNRRLKSLARLRIGIHAGLAFDRNAIAAATPYLTPEQIVRATDYEYPHGVILCTAFVDLHSLGPLGEQSSKHALIECGGSTQRWGLFLAYVEAIDPPIAAKGNRGIWTFDL